MLINLIQTLQTSKKVGKHTQEDFFLKAFNQLFFNLINHTYKFTELNYLKL